MRHAHFAATGDMPTTNEPCIGYDMMGRLENSYGYQRLGY
jgi:hypothetical protein